MSIIALCDVISTSLSKLFIYNKTLSIREAALMVHVTLVKPNVMQKLYGLNITIQLNV